MRRWLQRRLAVPVLLFVLVWLSMAWFGSWALNPNNSTRLFAAISLVEDGDATIDEFADATIDKARFGDHVYLDKAPGMTLMAIPAVAAVRAATGQTSKGLVKRVNDYPFERFLTERLRLAAMLGPALLTALAAVALCSLASDMTGDARAGLVAAAAYALGSPAWGWSTTLFGHAPVAALLIIATWAVWRCSNGPDPDGRARWALAALAGAALGWAVVVEFQAVIAGSVIALWALWRFVRQSDRAPLIAAATAGGVAALLPMIGYNLLAFGVPIKFGYQGVVGFEGMQQGLFGLTYPKFPVIMELLFGTRRGLIWVAPVLILAPVGLARMTRHKPARDLGIIAIAVSVVVLMVNASYYYWDGGFSTGPRHSVPALPFLALGVGWLWHVVERRRARLAILALLGLSVAVNLMIAATDINAPETDPFPLWQPIFTPDFVGGRFRDLPSVMLGVSPWAGFWLYLAVAVALSLALYRAMIVRADQQTPSN